jgi:hypothetical protein
MNTIPETLRSLRALSPSDREVQFAAILSTSQNNLVKTHWTVTYDNLGHDMLSVADVTLVDANDSLLQLWLRNAAGGLWIPEIQPWEIAVVEFSAKQNVASTKIGLLDSKWTAEDIGRRYHYELWGYVSHGGQAVSFALEKWATYPGDA